MLFNVISGLPMQTADFRTPCFILYGGTFTNAEAPIGIFGIVPPIFLQLYLNTRIINIML